jgi:hypothetical protein
MADDSQQVATGTGVRINFIEQDAIMPLCLFDLQDIPPPRRLSRVRSDPCTLRTILVRRGVLLARHSSSGVLVKSRPYPCARVFPNRIP